MRTFLLVFTALCVWLGWYSVRVEQQREAVKWVLKNGGTVRYDYEHEGQKFIPGSQPSVPKWLLDILGVDCFSAVTWVEFTNQPMQVDNVTPLAVLTNLEILLLSDTQVSDITPLAGLVNLEQLRIYNTRVDDVTPLAGLTNLKILLLSDTQIRDVALLAGLTNLEVLMLAGTRVSDVTPLAGLTNLEVLTLHNTQVSDVTPLTGLVNLKELWLSNTPVSEGDTEKLKQVLPNCVIEINAEFL